jgi:RNA polymerase sigma factor (TIGR02999 family)
MVDITRDLGEIESGDPTAAEELLPLVYEELRKLAAMKLAAVKLGDERADPTLQATALVHEAYIRLVDGGQSRHWNSRGHFFAAAAEAMRRIIVESARRNGRLKRGGGQRRQDLLAVEPSEKGPDDNVLTVDDALAKLERLRPDMSQLVKLRYFAGLTLVEAAAVLEISLATAERRWCYARAWLASELRSLSASHPR